jgi:serine/threonine-protein kinase
MAEIWVARPVDDLEGRVVVKTIRAPLAADLGLQQMFLEETRLASRIAHARVPRIFEVGTTPPNLFLVMEWIEGETLDDISKTLAGRGQGLPWAIGLRVLLDACAGLHAAHEHRAADGRPASVVHRDVSPHNIVVGMNGISKLIDFGLATALDGSPENREPIGTLQGRIQFMAPEQAMGQPVDRRADLWSVGAVLYQLFAGRPPFYADNRLAVLQKLTSGARPPPLPETVPRSLLALIESLLRHEPSERGSSVERIRTELERATIELGLESSWADVASFMARHFGERAAERRRRISAAIEALGS